MHKFLLMILENIAFILFHASLAFFNGNLGDKSVMWQPGYTSCPLGDILVLLSLATLPAH